jgi:hypothetical protein
MLDLMAVDGPALLDLESEFYDSYVVQYPSHEIQPYICDVFELRPERVGKLVLGSVCVVFFWVAFPNITTELRAY